MLARIFGVGSLSWAIAIHFHWVSGPPNAEFWSVIGAVLFSLLSGNCYQRRER